MQISVSLQRPFVSQIILLIVVVSLLLLIALYFYIKKTDKKVKEIKQEIKHVNINDKQSIKTKYIKKIDDLVKDIEENKIDTRHAYQKLSAIIRYFVYEMTNIKVQNYTLREIKKINMDNLYELIKEYYTPEFSKKALGEVKSSIERTREVIEKWN